MFSIVTDGAPGSLVGTHSRLHKRSRPAMEIVEAHIARSSVTAEVICVRGLSFTYPKSTEPVVSGMDFSVGRGEIFGFLGPSGAGKSTTQKILIGLLRGHGGEASVWG